MQIFIPVLLNIVYPGSGYLYLKDDFRKTIAKFLVFVWTLFIIGVLSGIGKSLIAGYSQTYAFDIPDLAWLMWGFMVYDTYRLAKSKAKK